MHLHALLTGHGTPLQFEFGFWIWILAARSGVQPRFDKLCSHPQGQMLGSTTECQPLQLGFAWCCVWRLPTLDMLVGVTEGSLWAGMHRLQL